MKKISFSIIAFCLMLCMGTNPLFSQDDEEEASDTTAVEDLEDEIDEAFLEEEGFDEEPEISESWFKLPGGLSLRSAGVNLGFYKPSMAYWNDSYGSSAQHPNTPWTVSSSFGMSFLFQAGMRLNLNAENTLWTELEVGFWSGSAELKGTYAADGANGTEKIEYSIMPMNISVGYSLSDLLPFDGIYAGAGLGANKITMTHTTDSDTPKESSGFGTMYHLLVGYDYPLTDQLSLGAELQIALGGHKHSQVSETSDTVPVQTTEQKDISLSGPKILLQLNYLFQTDND